jgi:integrase
VGRRLPDLGAHAPHARLRAGARPGGSDAVLRRPLTLRRRPSRTGRGYSAQVVERAFERRADGLTLEVTAERLRVEVAEADHITKDTLASLLRRHAEANDDDRIGTSLDPRTVNYVHTIDHRAFKDALRWGRLARNPADAADPPRGGPKSTGVHAWDAATLRAFLTASSESADRLHPLWVLLAMSGMRRGEALGLRWSDVDLDTGRLHIVRTIIQVRSKVTIGEPKTARGRRPIALDGATVAVLREHRRQALEQRLLVGPSFHDRGLVFHHPDGSCLKPDAVSAFVRRVRAAGLPRLTLKGLRHTWVTLALESGIHPRVVQERLGHSATAITLGIYSHVAPTLHDEAAQLVADLMLDG